MSSLYDDRITSLPNSLITKILSCLPTIDAVATSVLSTKWKRSWMSITNLDFDDSIQPYEADEHADTLRKFSDFVTRVLLLRERTCLQRVSLRCYRDYGDSLINAWLSAIVQCSVQELYISIDSREELPGLLLSSDIFRCNTLVVLKLWGDVKTPTSACLPALRTFDLSGVFLDDEASFTSLLSGCPLLEELSLWENIGAHMHCTSRVLRKLTIESSDDEHIKDEYEIVIDTPALGYLHLDGCFRNIYILSKMNHLIEANLSIGYAFVHDDEFYSDAIRDLVKGISQVQTLVLSYGTILSISSCDLVLPKFSKLAYLKVEADMEEGCSWCVLAELLMNSPCLETLYIAQPDEVDRWQNSPVALPFDDPPPCFFSHLKEVKIEYFQNSDFEMKVVEYILNNAKVLEKLIFDTPNHCKVNPDFVDALLPLPTASPNCKVLVV